MDNRRNINIGDLITYNAGGMKNKTLGLVLDIVKTPDIGGGSYANILIQWCVVGKLMPRRGNNPKTPNVPWNFDNLNPGELAWHSNKGKWFEVVQ